MPDLPAEQSECGVGCGFITGCDGRIITNVHGVDGADPVKVTLNDGRCFDGKVLGEDPVTDVAVIQADDVQRLVEYTAVNSRLSLQIKRNGQSKTIAVQPGGVVGTKQQPTANKPPSVADP